jgi:superoxide dismutase
MYKNKESAVKELTKRLKGYKLKAQALKICGFLHYNRPYYRDFQNKRMFYITKFLIISSIKWHKKIIRKYMGS